MHLLLILPLCLTLREDKPPTVDELAPHASGIALVEVVSVRDVDSRPLDGPRYTEIKLRVLKSTGAINSELHIIKEFGGLQPPGAPRKPPVGVLKPNTLKKGQKYWIAFGSRYDPKDPEGVINFWAEDDPKVADVLDEAVRADRLQWRPQYDPQLGLSHGYRVDAGNRQWTIRVEKQGKVVWQKVIPGVRSERYFAEGLWDNGYDDFPRTMPRCGKILIAETAQTLEQGNEFNLPPRTYYVCTAYDPETGQRLAVWVSRHQTPHVNVLHRDYDPENNKLREERQYDWLETGGKAAGAQEERWGRMIVRTFDAEGKVNREETFRYEPSPEGARYVKIQP